MINLRYHIISITAVFLALGIGLTLGSTFLDRVTVDTLKNQLETVESQVRETRAENDDLSSRVDALEVRDDAFSDELPERLLAGHLDGVPVLVVAARGTDEALLDATVASLSAAGANLAGTWWITDRWELDDGEEVRDLSGVLDLGSDDADRLRRNAAIQVAAVLDAASEPPPSQPVMPAGLPGSGDASGQVVPADPSEPALIASLEDAGFLDYEALAGSNEERVLLPGASARYVVVSGAAPESGQQRFATALLDEVVAGGVASVVAAQDAVELPDADPPASEDERRSTFVGLLRESDITRDRLSTVDDLDTAAGLVALVLAVEDLGQLRTGHYGVAPGAARLLPGADAGT